MSGNLKCVPLPCSAWAWICLHYPYEPHPQVFKASHPGMPLRVYFLLYDSSVEEQVCRFDFMLSLSFECVYKLVGVMKQICTLSLSLSLSLLSHKEIPYLTAQGERSFPTADQAESCEKNYCCLLFVLIIGDLVVFWT